MIDLEEVSSMVWNNRHVHTVGSKDTPGVSHSLLSEVSQGVIAMLDVSYFHEIWT